MKAADHATHCGGRLVSKFHRHKFLTYQGYSFPWFITLIWITYFTVGLWYLIRNVLLS